MVVEKLGPGFFENGQGQGSGPGVEIVDALFGHGILHCGWCPPAARQGVDAGHGRKVEINGAVLSKFLLLVNGVLFDGSVDGGTSSSGLAMKAGGIDKYWFVPYLRTHQMVKEQRR
jgi:hypothetical protein